MERRRDFSELGANISTITWEMDKLKPFQKDFYKEHPDTRARSQAEIKKFMDSNQITVKGKDMPKPVFAFEEAGFDKQVLGALKESYKQPSAIQSQGWPVALGGRDMIGVAETGSGKTLAFMLPAFVHVNAQENLRRGDGPIVLVLAPTRELVMQIDSSTKKFSSLYKISTLAIYGGVPKDGQRNKIQNGVDILIATPGRLLDFIEGGVVKLNRVTFLVLDEADRMLDMGFEKDIKKILNQVRPDRQTLFWSATWPKEVQDLARSYCNVKPVHVQIGNPELTANTKIRQEIIFTEDDDKFTKFLGLIKKINDGSRILVFCETKRGVDQCTRELQMKGLRNTKGIHGDKSQYERDQVIKDFKEGTSNIMVATDVASRGLDVKDIKYVINLDLPSQIEDYVHRIGRTARGGSTGTAYSFFVKKNGNIAKDLLKLMNDAGQKVTQELKDAVENARFAKSNNNYRKWRPIGDQSNSSYQGGYQPSTRPDTDQFQGSSSKPKLIDNQSWGNDAGWGTDSKGKTESGW